MEVEKLIKVFKTIIDILDECDIGCWIFEVNVYPFWIDKKDKLSLSTTFEDGVNELKKDCHLINTHKSIDTGNYNDDKYVEYTFSNKQDGLKYRYNDFDAIYT